MVTPARGGAEYVPSSIKSAASQPDFRVDSQPPTIVAPPRPVASMRVRWTSASGSRTRHPSATCAASRRARAGLRIGPGQRGHATGLPDQQDGSAVFGVAHCLRWSPVTMVQLEQEVGHGAEHGAGPAGVVDAGLLRDLRLGRALRCPGARLALAGRLSSPALSRPLAQ